jgi:hypothetical protein
MSKSGTRKTETPNNGDRYQPTPFDRVIRKLVNTPPIHKKDKPQQKRKKKPK